MESFHWGALYETGLDQVDLQHRLLVEIINRLGTYITENSLDVEGITVIFGELADYVQKHFDDEEKLMAKSGVDNRHVDIHIVQHKDFLSDVIAIHKRVENRDPAAIESLHRFLVHWLTYHILGADQNMARQIRSIEKGSSSAKAYEIEERSASSRTEPLLEALNGLFKQVSLRNKELQELNETLETKVVERTQQLAQANADLEIIALTDSLTELPNRRHAMLQFHQLWKEATDFGTPLACMMIDADGFKAINDNYGHDAGDIVLQSLARELHHSVRSDDIVCRMGGDEFVVICPNTTLEGVLYLAGVIRKKISSLQVKAAAGCWYGSISIGVAIRSESVTCVDSLLKIADESVYLAKNDGKNCVRSKQMITAAWPYSIS